MAEKMAICSSRAGESFCGGLIDFNECIEADVPSCSFSACEGASIDKHGGIKHTGRSAGAIQHQNASYGLHCSNGEHFAIRRNALTVALLPFPNRHKLDRTSQQSRLTYTSTISSCIRHHLHCSHSTVQTLLSSFSHDSHSISTVDGRMRLVDSICPLHPDKFASSSSLYLVISNPILRLAFFPR